MSNHYFDSGRFVVTLRFARENIQEEFRNAIHLIAGYVSDTEEIILFFRN